MSQSLPPLVPDRNWLLGCALQVRDDPVGFLNTCIERYGAVFRINVAGRQYVVVDAADSAATAALLDCPRDLSLRQGGLEAMRFDLYLPDAAAVHLSAEHPALVRDFFSPQRSAAAAHHVHDAVHAVLDRTAAAGDDIEISALALSLVATTSAVAFVGPRLARDPHILAFFSTAFVQSEAVQVVCQFLPRWLVPLVVWLLFSFAPFHDFRTTIKREIKMRRLNEHGDSRDSGGDLLQHMIEANKEDEKLVTEIILIVIATMRNTALMTTNLLHEMATRPEIVARIRAETLPLGPEAICQVKSAPLLDAFVRETLFQNAKPISTVRLAINDAQIGNYIVPRGSLVLLYGSRLHGQAYMPPRKLDAKPDTGDFDPDRWLDSGKFATTTGSSIVFFGGGRANTCPGRFLAVVELKCVAHCVAGSYDISIAGDSKAVGKDIQMQHILPAGASGTRSKKKVFLTLRKRS
ncbi:hypothetical protein HDU82_006327 [Entophlyctis luteolus]|nr:hypothetical protein HDU82_006327 [Entophlyctis luteolus]